MKYSIIIKNGNIVDGSGNDAYEADIGVLGEKIITIGNLSKDSADEIINADGLCVSPGFIDITNHSDVYGTLFYIPTQESMLLQGISTILVGNCGESLAPIVKKDSLETLERWTNFSINADWNSMKDYLNKIENNGIGVNIATLVGQETLRRNSKSIEESKFLSKISFEEGAWGLSSNFSFSNWNLDLEKETKILLNEVKQIDGIYKVHIKDEGKNFLPAIAEVVELARKSGVNTVISHFKAVGKSAWMGFEKAIEIIEKAQAEGVNIALDLFPYLRSGSQLVSLLPNWAREGTNSEILFRIKDSNLRKYLISDLEKSTLHAENILIASASADKHIVGNSLKEIAENIGKTLEETILDILLINNLGVTIFGRTINQKNLLSVMKKKYSAISSNGAGYDLSFKNSGDLVHPRSFGAFPRFIRIAQNSGIKVEEFIKKITHLPASYLKIKNRGLLKKDSMADITIFDLKSIKDCSTYKNPFKFSLGVEYVIVSGGIAVKNNQVTKTKFGKVLRKSGK